MPNSEEKFFEDLARFGSTAREQEVQVGLAKATTLGTRKAAAKKQDEDVSTEQEGQLTIDVYQTSSDIVIESAIAGVKPEDIDIDVSSDAVTIRGERHRENEVSDEDYFYQECYWGKFSRSVVLPQEVDPDAATVGFKKGILTIRLPKVGRSTSKKLKVSIE